MPPVAAFAVMLPVPPLQFALVCEAIVIATAVGWVMLADDVRVHPLASVMVTE